MRKTMQQTCLNRGSVMAQKGLTAYKHYCAVVDNKRIVSERVNQYTGNDGTEHAEESALLQLFMSRKSRGLHKNNCCPQDRYENSITSTNYLFWNGFVCFPIRVQQGWYLGNSEFETMRSLCSHH